jgi:hypothetical protein
MKSTSWRLLVAVASVAAVLGWALARIVESLAGRYFPISWTAAGAIWLLAIALLMWTWVVRPKLLRRPGAEPIAAPVAARTAALALASSRAGAAVAGLYAGVAVSFLSELATPVGRESAVAASLATLGGLAIVAVALWLERLCTIDDDEHTEL